MKGLPKLEMKLFSFVSQNHHVRFHILRWQISCIFFLPAVRLKWGPLNICLVIDLLDLPHGVRCTAAALDRQPSKTRVMETLIQVSRTLVRDTLTVICVSLRVET